MDIVKNILADWKKHGKFLYEDIPPFITSSDWESESEDDDDDPNFSSEIIEMELKV